MEILVNNTPLNEFQEIIEALQKTYNILIVYHPSNPGHKRVFVVQQFTPIQSSMSTCIDLRGKEITDLISVNFFSQYSINRQTGLSSKEFQESVFETKLSDKPNKHIQFSPDYCWEWNLSM